MRAETGELFEYLHHNWIVVTTNIGWTIKRPSDSSDSPVGPNPMGTGTALALAKAHPDIPYWYGALCFKYKEAIKAMWHPRGFVLFPTKALNADKPHLSWQAKSNLVLIEKSLKELQAMTFPTEEELAAHPFGNPIPPSPIYLPLVGCASGRLSEKQVRPLMESILDDRFVLLKTPELPHAF